MNIYTFLFLAVAAAIVIYLQGRIMGKYWDRGCMGTRWKRRFPDAPKSEIRKFLTAFVDGFAFMNSRRLKFEPDDRVMDIYFTLYPKNWPAGDQMECETFVEIIKSKYGVDLVPVWKNEITLGEIFALTRNKTT